MGELKSREKYNELVALLQQAGDEWVVPGPAMSDDDVAEGFRNLTPGSQLLFPPLTPPGGPG